MKKYMTYSLEDGARVTLCIDHEKKKFSLLFLPKREWRKSIREESRESIRSLQKRLLLLGYEQKEGEWR